MRRAATVSATLAPDHERQEDPSPNRDGSDVRLDATEVRRRASVALFVVGSWGAVNLVTAFFGNLVLARLLDPRAFGIVAVGSTVLILMSAAAEGGLGNAYIRRPEPPAPSELRTLAGLQLVFTSIGTLVVVAVAIQFGETGDVVALMVLAVPIATMQSPGRVKLYRDLRFRQVTIIDASSVLAFYAWSVTTVALGAGVWGLASGTVVRAVAGTAVIAILPEGRLWRPSFERIREIGPILRFGVRFQANWAAIVFRDQGVNAVTAARGGLETLGLWSLATRVLLMPMVLYETVGRVTFPSMSHLLSEGRDVRPLIERIARLTAAGSCFTLAPLVAGAPGLVPALFGDQWQDAVEVFPGACLGLFIAGCATSASDGYLFAADRPGAVVRATMTAALAWIATSAVLVAPLGVAGVGVGAAVGASFHAAVLSRAVRRHAGADILRPLGWPLAISGVAAAAGWALTTSTGSTVAGGVAGAACAAVIAFVLLALFHRPGLVDLGRVARRSARDALDRR